MLQEELTSTENKVGFALQFYNDTVQRYNTKIQTFPAVVIAGAMSFTPREYFEVDEQSREPVRVSFDTTQPAQAADQPPATDTPPGATGQPPATGPAPQ